MDMSSSLDVLVRQGGGPTEGRTTTDPLIRVIKSTQQKIGAAFQGDTKKIATYRKN